MVKRGQRVAAARKRMNSQNHRSQQFASNWTLGMPAHKLESVAALEELGAFVQSDVKGEAVFVNLHEYEPLTRI